MGIDLAEQARTFLGAAVLGMGLGLVYDIFRVLRRRLDLPLLGALLDLTFWALTAGGLLGYALASGGRLRLYMAAALFLGAVLYFLLLSPPALLAVGLAADAAALLLRLLLLPLDRLARLGKKIS